MRTLRQDQRAEALSPSTSAERLLYLEEFGDGEDICRLARLNPNLPEAKLLDLRATSSIDAWANPQMVLVTLISPPEWFEVTAALSRLTFQDRSRGPDVRESLAGWVEAWWQGEATSLARYALVSRLHASRLDPSDPRAFAAMVAILASVLAEEGFRAQADELRGWGVDDAERMAQASEQWREDDLLVPLVAVDALQHDTDRGFFDQCLEERIRALEAPIREANPPSKVMAGMPRSYYNSSIRQRAKPQINAMKVERGRRWSALAREAVPWAVIDDPKPSK